MGIKLFFFAVTLLSSVLVTQAATLRIEDENIRYGDMPADVKLFDSAHQFWTQGNYSMLVPILNNLSAKGYRKAITNLGDCFSGGYGLMKSTAVARVHWRRAALLGDAVAMARLANNFSFSGQDSSPKDSAFWSVVCNAFEKPGGAFSIGLELTSERLGLLSVEDRTFVLMTAKEMIERIKVNKARYEAVISPEL